MKLTHIYNENIENKGSARYFFPFVIKYHQANNLFKLPNIYLLLPLLTCLLLSSIDYNRFYTT